MSQVATLSALARQQGAARPDKLLFEHQDKQITYAEFDARVERVAQALRADGIARGTRIGFLGKNHPAYFELLFGAARAGLVMVPLNWRLAPDELRWIARDARISVVFAQEAFADVFETQMPPVIWIEAGYEAWRDAANARAPATDGEADDIAVQLYTSGTTGRPKGAQLTHRNLLCFRTLPLEEQPDWNRFTEDDVGLLVMPVFHIGGTGFGVQTIAAGASALITSEFDADQIMEAIANKGLSKLFVVPTALRMLVNHPRAAATDYARIRTILYGASPIPLDLLRDAMALFKCGFVQMYGMTETTGTVCVLLPEDHDPDGNERMLSAGRAMKNVEIAIRDEDGLLLPVGEIGEICVRSPTVMAGYWNRPKETAEVLSEDGWFRTGDAGYLDEAGYLFLKDRMKDMIVSGGENVYPAEVERVLGEHPDIAEVAVIGVPSKKWGEEVMAVLVSAKSPPAPDDEIIAWARTRLAGYKLPKQICYLADLPRGSTGKVLRRELRRQFCEPQV
jgi:O-succinylbenzoate-CoA ligase